MVDVESSEDGRRTGGKWKLSKVYIVIPVGAMEEGLLGRRIVLHVE